MAQLYLISRNLIRSTLAGTRALSDFFFLPALALALALTLPAHPGSGSEYSTVQAFSSHSFLQIASLVPVSFHVGKKRKPDIQPALSNDHR